MQPNVAEVVLATSLYIVLVIASVVAGQPDLAGFATLTILPLGLLLGLYRDVPLRRKLANVGWFWYLLPLAGFVVWTANHPGHPIAFLVGTLCLMIFFVCLASLVQLYWIERRNARDLHPGAQPHLERMGE